MREEAKNDLSKFIIKPKKISEGVLEYPKIYHGTPTKGIEELDPQRSKRTAFGANAVVSGSENPLLSESFTRGELGDKPRGEIRIIKGPLKILDLTSTKGKNIWDNLANNPQKALEAGYDGIQHLNYEKRKIEAFYKDISYDKVKNGHEIQIFRKVKTSEWRQE